MTTADLPPNLQPSVDPTPPAGSSNGVMLLIFLLLLIGVVVAVVLLRPGAVLENRAPGPSEPNGTGRANGNEFADVPGAGEDPSVRFGIVEGFTPTLTETDEQAIDALGSRFLEAWQSTAEVNLRETFDFERMLWEVALQTPAAQRDAFRQAWGVVEPQSRTTVAHMFAAKLIATLAYDRVRRAGELDPQSFVRFRTEPVPGRPEVRTWWRLVAATGEMRRMALWLTRLPGGQWRVYDVMDEGDFVRLSSRSPLVYLAFERDINRANEVFAAHQQTTSLLARIAARRYDVPLARVDELQVNPDLYGWYPLLDVQRIQLMIREQASADDIRAAAEPMLARPDANPLLHVWLGNHAYATGDNEGAIRHFQAYRELVDDSDRINAALGSCHTRGDNVNVEAALEAWQAWIDIAPQPGMCHLFMVAHHRERTHNTTAGAALLADLLMHDAVAPARIRDEINAMIDGLAGPDGAAAIITMIGSLEPTTRPADCPLLLARAHAALGDPDLAANTFAFQLADESAPIDVRRAAWLDRLDLELTRDVPAALSWLDAHSDLARNDADQQLLRAAVLMLADRPDDAAVAIAAAREADAGSIRWLVNDTRRHAAGTRELWTHPATSSLLTDWHQADTGTAFELPPPPSDDPRPDWRRRTRTQ